MNPKLFFLLPFVFLSLGLSPPVYGQILPGPADAGRIRPEEKLTLPDHSGDREIAVPAIVPSAPIPEAARGIHFVLHSVSIEGATAFAPSQLSDIYAPYIGKEVTLDIAWLMAGAITERYHAGGYFLSRAYVPQQRIKDGGITIKVIEGYIGKVELPGDMKDSHVIGGAIDRLTARRPVTTDEVEDFLLRMNDLPGYSFRAVLSPQEDQGEDAAVKLTLAPAEKDGKGFISFDNASSRYLGPNEVSASYSKSFLPLQQTTVSVLSSLPADKLRYGTLSHMAAIAPDITLELNGGVTRASPGYTLKRFDIDSRSIDASLALSYQWLRQRQENLAFKLALDRRDVASDILHAPQTRDAIRAARLGATYDKSDAWQGYNVANVTLSQGIDGLGSSHKSDPDLSRAGAVPDFTKAELALTRLQGITEDWSLLAAASGQWASGVLYSSEQFGYGGQSFGRAYDASEITGDQGISGSLELRYGGFGSLWSLGLQPYGFYDIGTVWNQAAGQPKRESGASAGLGVRFATDWRQTGNLGLAWPLTRDIAAPVYGEGSHGPRILLQVGQEF